MKVDQCRRTDQHRHGEVIRDSNLNVELKTQKVQKNIRNQNRRVCRDQKITFFVYDIDGTGLLVNATRYGLTANTPPFEHGSDEREYMYSAPLHLIRYKTDDMIYLAP